MKKVLKIIAINLLIFIALLAVVDISSMIIIDTSLAFSGIRRSLVLSTRNADMEADLQNYKDTPWAKTFFQELHLSQASFKSYYDWRRNEFKGETINIDSLGIRKTTGKIIKNVPVAVFLGGSTMWGTGADDDGTIPSLFKKKIGDKFNVLNYGEAGYTAYQSLIFLQTQMAKGLLDSPRLIISYDGVNNSFRGRKYFSHRREEQIGNLLKDQDLKQNYLFMKYTRTFINKIVSEYSYPPEPVFSDIDDRKAAIELLNTWVMMQNLAHSRGSDFLCILQPNIFVGSPNFDNLNNTSNLYPFKDGYRYYKYVSEFINTKDEYKQLEASFIDMTNVLDNIPNVYIDFCHISPNGNEIIATNLLKRITTE
jgi:hypothetical protein